MSRHLLITGGAGFIGSHFVLRHVRQFPGDRIVVLDKLTYAADLRFLDPVKDKVTFVKGDICDQALVAKLVSEHRIDTIVNFAAESHVDNSIGDAAPFLQTNVLGVQSLIEVCKQQKGLKLLHISTDEVYGDLADDDPPKRIGDPLCPSSPYAASKAAAEMLVMAAMRTFKIPACVTRCTNNFGPHQASEKFIPTVIRSALQDKPVPIYAEGKNRRDWLFVTDHTDAVERVLATDWAFADPTIGSGHFFNISADDERQNIDVAKAILQLLRKPESLLTFVKDRPGHDWRYALDSSSVRKLGWKPAVRFEEGLKKTVEWYRSIIVFG
jgi:dTDP-glucose 4,6-dehydratase